MASQKELSKIDKSVEQASLRDVKSQQSRQMAGQPPIGQALDDGYAKNHQGESGKADITLTAEQIQKQLQQETETKLRNKGVHQKAAKISKAASGNQSYIQGQQDVAKAYAAGEKMAKDFDAMQINTSKNASTIQSEAEKITDDMLYTAAKIIDENKPKKTQFGMDDDSGKKLNDKKLGNASFPERPQARFERKTLTSPTPESPDVIIGGTTADAVEQSEDTSVPGVSTPSNIVKKSNTDKTANQSKTKSIPDNKVFFVPDADLPAHRYNAMVKGVNRNYQAMRFRPVVYVESSKLNDYVEIKTSGINVKDGFAQVDAYDFAKKNGCKLSDMLAKDRTYSEMKNDTDFANSKFPLKLQEYKMEVGKDINQYASSAINYDGLRLITANDKKYDADTFAASIYAEMPNPPKVKDMLKTCEDAYLQNDRTKYPEAVDEIDTANEFIQAKRGIISSISDKRKRYKAIVELTEDYEQKQEERYENNGFSKDEINSLKKTGQLGADSIYVKNLFHRQLVKNDISDVENQPLDNSGVIVLTSDSYKTTKFGQYLKQHESDITGYLGDAIGTAEGVKNQPSVRVIDSAKDANGITSCAVVYSGASDDTVRKVLSESLKETSKATGDNRIRMSDTTYAATPYEIRYAESYTSPYVKTNTLSIKEPVADAQLDSSLSVEVGNPEHSSDGISL